MREPERGPAPDPAGPGGGTHLDRFAQRHHCGHLVDRPGGAVRVAAVQLVRTGPDGLRGRPGGPRHRVQDRGGVPGQRTTRLTGRPVQQAAPHVLALGQVDRGVVLAVIAALVELVTTEFGAPVAAADGSPWALHAASSKAVQAIPAPAATRRAQPSRARRPGADNIDAINMTSTPQLSTVQ